MNFYISHNCLKLFGDDIGKIINISCDNKLIKQQQDTKIYKYPRFFRLIYIQISTNTYPGTTLVSFKDY